MQHNTKKIIGTIALSLVGLIFIVSAILKLYPSIKDFEYIIQSQLYFSDQLTFFSSRVFIGLELALGILLLCNIQGFKNWITYVSILLLLLFTGHLTILYFNTGNDINCGCMGSLIEMNPLQSILKNIGLFILLIVGLKLTPLRIFNTKQFYNLLSIGLILALISGTFVAYPQQKKITLDYSKMYHEDQPEQPKVNIKEGKHIICLMTLTCGHCLDAAKSIQEILNQTGTLPFYFIFPEPHDTSKTEEMLFNFLEETKTYNVPFHFVQFETFADYVKATGNTGTPVILMMDGNTVIKEVSPKFISVNEIKQWLRETN